MLEYDQLYNCMVDDCLKNGAGCSERADGDTKRAQDAHGRDPGPGARGERGPTSHLYLAPLPPEKVF